MKNPQHILITGGSSGIGEAIARHYAAPGIRLALCGRDATRLRAVADACLERGAEVSAEAVDVADKPAMAGWIAREDDQQPIDLVIANAGIGISHRDGYELGEVAERIFRVNVDGVFNTVHPAIERMKTRKKGQIAIVSSLAGYQGLASAPAYSASKSAVKAYAEGLRGHLAPEGIGVSAICPGFVESRLTARNEFHMPFLMTGEQAARLIARKLARNKGRISFPLPLLAAVRLMSLLPMGLIDQTAKRLPRK